MEQGVEGLRGGQVMGLGADAADAGRQVRHVLGRSADAELLEAAQLGDLQVGVGHIACVVQEDVDLAVTFKPRDGVDGNTFHGETLLRGMRIICRFRQSSLFLTESRMLSVV